MTFLEESLRGSLFPHAGVASILYPDNKGRSEYHPVYYQEKKYPFMYFTCQSENLVNTTALWLKAFLSTSNVLSIKCFYFCWPLNNPEKQKQTI